MAKRINKNDPGFNDVLLATLLERNRAAENVDSVVASILEEVKERGDDALIEYTERFDGIKICQQQLKFSAEEISSAYAKIDSDVISALKFAAQRIEKFHRHQVPKDFFYTDEVGVRLGLRWRPVDAVGLYVPGGSAAYPSSVLMNAIPARIAGVKRVAMVIPTPKNMIDPLLLGAAKFCGVDEIYRIGGAQAIGALAYGTETILAVDKIVGPGNSYVASAKKQVFGTVGIDMIAGPTEVLIVADRDNDPEWIAIDLLAQAEHDSDAQSILVTDDPSFADRVEDSIEEHLGGLNRREIARSSWENNGLIVIVDDLSLAPELIDKIAPEHVELAVDNPDDLAGKITHAGAIFLGRYTPEAVGDYVGGPNHILPTGGSARFSSGLSVLDFLKRTSVMQCGPESLKSVGTVAIKLAELEGLGAHARSIGIRIGKG